MNMVRNLFSRDDEVLRRCLVNRKSECKLMTTSQEKVGELFDSISCNEPLVFDCRSYQMMMYPTHTVVYPEYTMSDSEFEEYRDRCMSEAGRVVESIDRPDDVDFVRALHEYIIRNVEYEDTFHSHDVIGPLLNGRGVCEGISKMFKFCCDVRGIESANVRGGLYGEAPDHMWSRVRLGGRWYNVDVTGDLGLKSPEFVPVDYLLVSDRTLSKDHFYIRETPAICNSDDLDYYIVNGLVMANPAMLQDVVRSRSCQGRFDLAFRVADDNPGKNHMDLITRVLDSVFGEGRYALTMYANLHQYAYRIRVEHRIVPPGFPDVGGDVGPMIEQAVGEVLETLGDLGRRVFGR